MDISRQHKKEILQGLGAISPDNRTAEFYESSVIDNNASTGEAKRKADAEAGAKSLALGTIIDADYSIDNLKRLGAKTVMKKVIYVKIQHRGEKDNKSRLVTEQDKITFSKQWEQFNAKRNTEISVQPGKIRKKWDNLPVNTIRPKYENTQTNWNGGEFSHTFDISPC
jgi:hypothetical protein